MYSAAIFIPYMKCALLKNSHALLQGVDSRFGNSASREGDTVFSWHLPERTQTCHAAMLCFIAPSVMWGQVIASPYRIWSILTNVYEITHIAENTTEKVLGCFSVY